MSENIKIAVFMRSEREFRELRLLPKDLFVQIITLRDIRAVNYVGLIAGYNWHERGMEIKEAWEALINRHPELNTIRKKK